MILIFLLLFFQFLHGRSEHVAGADKLLRGFASLLELATDVTTRVDDVLCLEPGAILLRWSTSGRLTPAKATSIRIFPAAGKGRGPSLSCIHSAAPRPFSEGAEM